ncbi:MAG: CPBP family intramembrane metalloprotease [Bacteroidales bacterium]|nr:CPBP family intramembrane metalloprotease [Bacteroidales bacterium]
MAKKQSFWIWLLLLVGGSGLFMLAYGLSTLPAAFTEKVPLWEFVLLSLLSASAVPGLYALWRRLTEKSWPEDLSLKRLLPHTGAGFGIGILYFILVTGCMALLGGYRIESLQWDGRALLTSLMVFLLVGVGEEVLFRGIIFRMIDRRLGTWVALVVSALIFGFVHIMNQNATVWSSIAIAVEAGLLLGAAYKWSGTLWLPIGIHWAWNFFQGPVFGFAVSGGERDYSLVQPVIDGPVWLTGGSFGAEASIPAFMLGLAVAVAFIAACLKDRRG